MRAKGSRTVREQIKSLAWIFLDVIGPYGYIVVLKLCKTGERTCDVVVVVQH
jgi:hypothetical protein